MTKSSQVLQTLLLIQQIWRVQLKFFCRKNKRLVKHYKVLKHSCLQVVNHPCRGYAKLDLGEKQDLVKVLEDISPLLQKGFFSSGTDRATA